MIMIMEGRENPGMDRFSNLPEPIIHHIMSLLPTKKSTQMSILSKTLSSAWRSFPILDFNWYSFPKKSKELFMDFVMHSLQYRCIPSDSLEKLRLVSSGLHFDNRVEKVMNFAIDNNVKELEIEFCEKPPNIQCFPQAMFSARSITTLKLKGFKWMSEKDLILTTPWIENLSIVSCWGIKSITLLSTAKLKAAEFENCFYLQDIYIESTSTLESFSSSCRCHGEFSELDFDFPRKKFNLPTVPLKSNISGTTCPNLKHLRLNYVNIPDRWIKTNFSEFRYLETLEIKGCYHRYESNRYECNKNIKFHLEYLKTLVLESLDLDKVEIEAPSMVSFTYISLFWIPEIDISSSSTNLKHLQFHGSHVPCRWIRNNFSEFHFLETLELHECTGMKKMKFHHQHLKRLKLVSCVELAKVEVDAPNLDSLAFHGRTNYFSSPQVIFISRSKPDVIFNVFYRENHNYFPNLRNFIACFAQHCKTLTLHYIGPIRLGLIYPKKLRQSLLPPLYNFKHLKVQLSTLKNSFLVELVDSLLWLAPRPNTISIIVQSQAKSLKFHYKNIENVKSWQHDLKEVTMENFEDSERTILEDYFLKLRTE